MTPKQIVFCVVGGLLALVLLFGGCSMIKTVPAGHTSVATLFGNVVETVYDEGMQFPVNPLYD
jgi:hypothetical protein